MAGIGRCDLSVVDCGVLQGVCGATVHTVQFSPYSPYSQGSPTAVRPDLGSRYNPTP